MKSLAYSRKFWLAMLDAVVTILLLWVKTLLPEVQAELWVATIVAIQAPFVVLINGIAKEDAAAKSAGINPKTGEKV